MSYDMQQSQIWVFEIRLGDLKHTSGQINLDLHENKQKQTIIHCWWR